MRYVLTNERVYWYRSHVKAKDGSMGVAKAVALTEIMQPAVAGVHMFACCLQDADAGGAPCCCAPQVPRVELLLPIGHKSANMRKKVLVGSQLCRASEVFGLSATQPGARGLAHAPCR